MAPFSLRPLPENVGLAWIGEPGWALAIITSQQAQAMGASANPSRRPNTDVLRIFAGVGAGRMSERWQIDFPPHLTLREAALYQEPFSLLKQRCQDPSGPWWINPHAIPALRTALARLDRFLVSPVAQSTLSWTWIDSEWLPENSLLAVAREDDFTQAVLRSRLFALWWGAHIAHHALTLIVESFPFPWRPATPLGSLTGLQQDLRVEVSRAARSGTVEQISSAVATTYGWPADLTNDALLARLQDLHLRRADGHDRL